ncbi:MAG: bifunctional diaminohydroxyphosphoribosylaminopyrimidine deaminase/5-amino-6-(5-phosphoribosylamino)uracil reductase RibD [Odoribacter sp.]|nr:bifunctional diaminohydroxyphosphoribosylaminopyrimidine deaminase/5-amino-6-(5-phosphoribosylamino)uracil reductase RibD [Odoribacter sp.]
MTENADNKFMKRCLDLAVRAEGMTYPNPMVGSVIVHDGIIIGEGYHLKAGTPHAEVNAINSVSDKSLLRKSTLYVSLEPCSHSGKTPPCTDFIISNRIPKVVAGTTDSSEQVSGRGFSRLKAAGCDIISGVLESECRRINRRFFTFHEKKRPYITLKWAQSADGYIDVVRTGSQTAGPYWITGKSERVLVHRWRAEEEAILVGAGTIRADKPKLNVRYWKGNDPIRIILSRSADLNKYLTGNETIGPIIVFTCNSKPGIAGAKGIKLKKNIPSAIQVIEYLYNNNVQSLFIEGGAAVLNHFIENGLWDEARIFTGMVSFNNGVKAPSVTGRPATDVLFEKSRLQVMMNG